MRAYLNGLGQPYDFQAYSEITNNNGKLVKTNVGKAELLLHWEPGLHELMHVASDGWYFDPYSWIFTSNDFNPTALYVYRVPVGDSFICCKHSHQPATLQRYEPHSKTLLPKFVPSHMGGAVIAVVVDEDYCVDIGVSICSVSDPFDFRSGAQMAYDRALNHIWPEIENRTLKQTVWQIRDYYNSVADAWFKTDMANWLGNKLMALGM